MKALLCTGQVNILISTLNIQTAQWPLIMSFLCIPSLFKLQSSNVCFTKGQVIVCSVNEE